MNVKQRNNHFLEGNLAVVGLFPQLEQMLSLPVQFKAEFGLKELPDSPGLILIRGARQIVKSTWLEQQIRNVIESEVPASAIYLNGDELLNSDALINEINNYLASFFKEDLLIAYMLTGGSAIAINELIIKGRIPEYVIELTKD